MEVLTYVGTILTVGHGSRSSEEFLEVLSDSAVELLLDIRRYPGSRRHPHFARKALAAELGLRAIDYQWWGESMGGRRTADDRSLLRHGAWEIEAFRAYAAHMDTAEFRTALDRLLEVSRRRQVAIMCAERAWWRCHRRLVADALVSEGREVIHIGIGPSQLHRLSPIARLDEHGLLAYDRGQQRLDD